jgi:adenosylcobinamide kinase/adenosylcobinamide-phosphate guanylyltransferase
MAGGSRRSTEAVLIATAHPWDDEMRERIRRHQQDRAERVPGMRHGRRADWSWRQAITRHSAANTLIVVDCLTLWLTNLMMPAATRAGLSESETQPQ